MTYVKTVWGNIFETRDWHEQEFKSNDFVPVVSNNQDYNKRAVNKKNIVAESDNLEDLVEAYIVIRVSDNSKVVYKVRDFNRTSHKALCIDIALGEKKVYAATWKGINLVSVATFDEKGELKLL